MIIGKEECYQPTAISHQLTPPFELMADGRWLMAA
jgi:hypothetical protein